MMKELKIQSIADVITNSSSEIFVIQDPKNLEGTLESYGGFLHSIKEYCNLFLEKEHVEGCYMNHDSWEDCFEVSIANHKDYDHDYGYGFNVGDLLVESVSDNTIPCEVMDYIEESADAHGYQCKRSHLG